MVCTLHIVAFYPKIIKRHILIEKVSLNLILFMAGVVDIIASWVLTTNLSVSFTDPLQMHSAGAVEVEGIVSKKGRC
jgi:hypothetical protein